MTKNNIKKGVFFISLLMICSFFLTGCSGPSTHEMAEIALYNTFYIYLISLLTLFIYFFIIFKDKFSFSKFTAFAENFIKKTILKFFIILVFVYIINIIISFLQIIGRDEKMINNIIAVLNPITLFIVIITTTIPVILYTVILIFLIKGRFFVETNIDRALYWVPSIITIFYFLNFLTIFVLNYYLNIDNNVLMAIWTWPILLLR